MRTRNGFSYSSDHCDDVVFRLETITGKRSFSSLNEFETNNNNYMKRRRFASPKTDLFDSLPDDLVISVLCKLSSSAERPADFVNVLATCRRLNGLGLNSLVLSNGSRNLFAFRAKNWSNSAHRFLKLAAESGNVEASYTLGMIRFYCLQNRGSGASLMAKAAISSFAPALYSLAVIQFNGSGGLKSEKDLRAGVALCARAAFLGHIDALREFGHCLQDGYGVRQNIIEGHRFLIQANARELAAVISNSKSSNNDSLTSWTSTPHLTSAKICPLLSDFGCNVQALEAHPVNKFLFEWFAEQGGESLGMGLRMCSHEGCGRPETRKHEFRRCSVCGIVNYCSRACQALDWKLRHKSECVAVDLWNEEGDDYVDEGEMEMDDS